MKYIFIINKKAGRGKSEELIENIEKACKNRGLDYDIRRITDELNGATIAAEYLEGENVIYVVGGDGTLTKTLSGIIGTENSLGVIPAGSGNDSYKTIRKLPHGKTKIDIGKINDTYFINTACTGIDAEVGNNIDILRNTIIPTKHLYTASILYTFFKYKFRKVKFKTNVKEMEKKYTILTICNGGYYGGGYNIAPKAMLTDGMLDIYYAEKMNKFKIIPLLLKLKNGKHEGKRYVHKFRSNHVELEFEEEVTFNIDGEKLTDSKFVIDLMPEKLTIYNDEKLIKEILTGKEKTLQTM